MNITAVIIVFNGSFVLKQVLESLYDHCEQILISEGPVRYWQDRGYTTSNDGTNETIDRFPDPKQMIKVIHGQFEEKTEQCNAVMPLVKSNTDYILQCDSDECWSEENLVKLKEYLAKYWPTSMGVRSTTFYGGFDHVLTGFENKCDNFLRVFKYQVGMRWVQHRPPTMRYVRHTKKIHITSDELYSETGITFFHYSYTFARQVFEKMQYYTESVNPNNCISDYFNRVYLPWVLGDVNVKMAIEKEFAGLQEFIKRSDCYSEPFHGKHPEAIQRDLPLLQAEFDRQLKKHL